MMFAFAATACGQSESESAERSSGPISEKLNSASRTMAEIRRNALSYYRWYSMRYTTTPVTLT